jgi:Ca2+-binding RTX toxin-like protein
VSNDIVVENQKQGTPERIWRLQGPPSTNIEGFATDISVNVGGDVNFKINTDSTHYRIDIYRLGYYGGDGARNVDSIEHVANTAVSQPAPLMDPNTGLVDAGNWSVTDTWHVPADAVSGVYVANLIREDGTAGESQVPFIIRNDAGHSDIVFQTSDATWEAYNGWGGDSYYPDGTHYAVSYNRPLAPQLPQFPYNTVIDNEYPAIKWLEQNGYDISYIASPDTARYPSLLLNHQVYMDTGHDEYWSADQRAAVTAARDAGVNLAFWSGNEMFWETRWGPSIDGSNTDFRTLTSYKGNHAIDPGPGWTGTWSDPSQPDGPQPQNALTGTLFSVSADRHDTINVSSDFSKLRFWASTSVASLQDGQSVNLSAGGLGHEWDSDIDNGFRPAGLIDLSATSLAVDGQLFDSQTQTLGSGVATHNLTLYRAPSGALVFGAGDVFWPQNVGGSDASRDAQQAMVNLFADMGVQPETLQANLVRASQSTDTTPPTSAVTTANTFILGQNEEIFGTAVDTDGAVASVEVSLDNGMTWHHAGGTDNWYLWWSGETGSHTYHVMTRAVDDSLNLEVPTESHALQIGVDGGGVLYGSRTNGDIMVGGQGNNVYEVTNANDRVIQGPTGIGSVWSYLPSYTLPQNVDILVLGQGALNGAGNGEGDLIIGNSGDNVIDSGGGNATLTGGGGHDTFVFDAAERAGQQSVTDFIVGDNGDVIDVKNSQYQNFNEILSAITDDGHGNAVITLDAQHSMTLDGISRNQLVAANFHFGAVA